MRRRLSLVLMLCSLAVTTGVPASAQDAQGAPAGTGPATAEGSSDTSATVVGVEASADDGFDRIMFSFDGALPGYRVQYVDAVTEPEATGDSVLDVRGGALLHVVFEPATGTDDDGTTFADETPDPDLLAVDDIQFAGDGATTAEFAVGVAAETGFRVTELTDGIALDVAHPPDAEREAPTPPDDGEVEPPPETPTTPDFADIDRTVHAANIETVAAAGVTAGCTAMRFCPDEPVTRDQMATFVAKALGIAAVEPSTFADLDGNPHAGNIQALHDAGVVSGCTATAFCPRSHVSRAQTATLVHAGFDVPASSVDWFAGDGGTHHAGINALAAAGITGGCNQLQTSFCPGGAVTRAQMATFLARAMDMAPTTSVSVTLQPGDEGALVEALQRRLARLRYWVGPIDGQYGNLTQQAVMAFQKANGLTRDGVFGTSTRRALGAPRAPDPRSGNGLWMEVDEARQLLIMVDDGHIQWIFNTSTGTERPYTHGGRQYLADTPNGQFTINRQINGWRTSNLGRLYRPKYFHPDGIAIHGSTSVPPYPASHGCVRVTIPAMDWLWNRVPVGTDVWVH